MVTNTRNLTMMSWNYWYIHLGNKHVHIDPPLSGCNTISDIPVQWNIHIDPNMNGN